MSWREILGVIPSIETPAAAAAKRQQSVCDALDAIARELGALDEAPGWLGDAGRAFERRVADCPDQVRRSAGVFDAATEAFTELVTDMVTSDLAAEGLTLDEARERVEAGSQT